MRELNDLCVKLAAFEKTDTNVVFHCGDGPRMGPNRPEGSDLVIEQGWVFQAVKPQLPMPPHNGLEARDKGLFARFGEGVVVTATGSRRIGKRQFGARPLGA